MDEYRIQEAVEAWREELATKPEKGFAVAIMARLTSEERAEAFARLGYPTGGELAIRREFDAIVAHLGDMEVQD